MKIALATTNQGKIREIREILDMPDVSWMTVNDCDEWPVIEETGMTFRANAGIKAAAVAARFNLPALADDSGLEVDALGGLPGINSARFAGDGATDADNLSKLVGELRARGLDRSPARFVSEVVIVWPDGRKVEARGVCDGEVIASPRGGGGFGYDPVFVPDGFDQTMAELEPGAKNRLSHRGQALRRLKESLDIDD